MYAHEPSMACSNGVHIAYHQNTGIVPWQPPGCNTPDSTEFKQWLWMWIICVKRTKSKTSAMSGAAHVSAYSPSIFFKTTDSQTFLRSIQTGLAASKCSTWMMRNILAYETFGKTFEYYEHEWDFSGLPVYSTEKKQKNLSCHFYKSCEAL